MCLGFTVKDRFQLGDLLVSDHRWFHIDHPGDVLVAISVLASGSSLAAVVVGVRILRDVVKELLERNIDILCLSHAKVSQICQFKGLEEAGLE